MKKMWDPNYEALDKISKKLSLPRDCVAGATIVHMVGHDSVCIENYRGIIEYTQECIKISAKHYQVVIQGKNLSIETFDKEEMQICGKVENIQYRYER